MRLPKSWGIQSPFSFACLSRVTPLLASVRLGSQDRDSTANLSTLSRMFCSAQFSFQLLLKERKPNSFADFITRASELSNWRGLHFVEPFCIAYGCFFFFKRSEKRNWYINKILEDEKPSSPIHPSEMNAAGYGKQP